jgi:hypothetical protein
LDIDPYIQLVRTETWRLGEIRLLKFPIQKRQKGKKVEKDWKLQNKIENFYNNPPHQAHQTKAIHILTYALMSDYEL